MCLIFLVLFFLFVCLFVLFCFFSLVFEKKKKKKELEHGNKQNDSEPRGAIA